MNRPVLSHRLPGMLWKVSVTTRWSAIRLQPSHPCPWSRTRQLRSRLPLLGVGEEGRPLRSMLGGGGVRTRSTGSGGGAGLPVTVTALVKRGGDTVSMSQGAHMGRGERRAVPRNKRSATSKALCPLRKARSFPGAIEALL